MLPTTQGPVLMPMPTFMGRKGWPAASASARRSALRRSSASSMRKAASQAFASCAASSSGAFQNAMMASPMYFVDCPVAVDDGVGKRRKEPIHQSGKSLRIMLVALGNRGEAAHIREQHRHHPLLTTEHELLG